MAHFKRKRPRTQARQHSTNDLRREHGDDWRWLRGYPRWWDIGFHTRPKRRQNKAMTRKVLMGATDADEATWNGWNTKPHVYYW